MRCYLGAVAATAVARALEQVRVAVHPPWAVAQQTLAPVRSPTSALAAIGNDEATLLRV